MASNELAKKLERRNVLNETDDDGEAKMMPSYTVFNPYTEFHEFSRKEIQGYEKTFKKYDTSNDKFIDFEELKAMMEKLGCPQTHLSLKAMIREVDEDHDNKINFREFLLIFRKAKAGELDDCAASGLMELYSNLSEIDVGQAGVGGASKFFEAKINEQSRGAKFEEEIRQEQEQKRVEAEERRRRQQEFKSKAAMFGQS